MPELTKREQDLGLAAPTILKFMVTMVLVQRDRLSSQLIVT